MVLERDLGSIPKGRSMEEMNKLFFELIRVAVGVEACLSHTPKATEWQELYAMAKKQSLVGVCFAGIQKLQRKSQCPPEVLYFQWMGMAAKIQQRNEVVNRQCLEVQCKLDADGFKSAILKGQGVASFYGDRANLRQSGDIDLWVDAPKEKVVGLARMTGSEDKASYLHVGAHYFNDTEVELHYRPTYMRCLWHNKRMQEWCESHKQDWVVRYGLVVPSYKFNVVYLLSHIYRHLFGMGIGLRQLMDYYYVLVNANARELTVNCSINSTLQHFGLDKFAGAVMWVLKDVFGLEREYMICEPDEWRGKALLECVMESGNFGRGQKKMPTWLRKLKQWSKLVVMYPIETLSDPVWRIYKNFK